MPFPSVRLGNSGLKVSKIILGTMQYGTSDWQKWILGEEEAFKHIKFAYVRTRYRTSTRSEQLILLHRYDSGIQTFDTADVSLEW
jgi:aryl-alcohol dehydrogenase-like predicted oxidoreductase